LVDAFHVPKLLSQQLLPFGRSGDGFEGLTFEVGLCSVLSVGRGQSACWWRTVRDVRVRRVFFMFLLSFTFDPLCFRVLVGQSFGRSACAGRTVRGCPADGPRVPRGRSVFRGSLLEVLLALTDSPRPRPVGLPYLCGQSAVPWRTVRLARADSSPLLAGRSARAWLFCSLVRFFPSFFRASACASRNHS
jgi:hypothetical protein